MKSMFPGANQMMSLSAVTVLLLSSLMVTTVAAEGEQVTDCTEGASTLTPDNGVCILQAEIAFYDGGPSNSGVVGATCTGTSQGLMPTQGTRCVQVTIPGDPDDITVAVGVSGTSGVDIEFTTGPATGTGLGETCTGQALTGMAVPTCAQITIDDDGDDQTTNDQTTMAIPLTLALPNVLGPNFDSVSITSSNTNNNFAKAGDTVTLAFTTDAAITNPSVGFTVGGSTYTDATPANENGDGMSWTAKFVVATGDGGGVVFTIAYEEDGDQPYADGTTDGSSVTVDTTPPSGAAVMFPDEVSGEIVPAETDTTIAVDLAIPVDAVRDDTVIFYTMDGGAPQSVAVADLDANDDFTVGLFVGTLGVTLEVQDAAGNKDTQVASVVINARAPTLSDVSIASDNAKDSTLAVAGDTVTLTLDATDDIQNVQVTFTVGGDAATNAVVVTEVDADDDIWTATFMVAAGEDGAVGFTIDFEDTNGAARPQVTAVTDGSSVAVDGVDPAAAIDFPQEVNGEVDLAEGETHVDVEFALPADVDLAASSGSYTTNGGTPIAIDLSAAAFQVPAFRGTLEVTLELEDAAGNMATTVDSTQVAPFVDLTLSLTEGGQDAAGGVRHFAEDQERTYTVTVTHAAQDDPVDAVVVAFSGEPVSLTDVDHPDAFVFTDNSGAVTAIEVNPEADLVDDMLTFTLTITGNPLLTGDEGVLTISAVSPEGFTLAEDTTTARGDRTAPVAPSTDFPSDANDDDTIDRAEYQNAGNQILLDLSALADNIGGSGVARVDVFLAGTTTLLDSATISEGDTVASLELVLADLEPGLNVFEVVVTDNVGNAATYAESITVAIEQRLVVTPGMAYVKPGSTGPLPFSLVREDFVDDVTKYDLRAKMAAGTTEFHVTQFSDAMNDPAVGTSGGTVRLVRYSGPDGSLAVNAMVTVDAGAADGENFFDLEPTYNPTNADVKVVDANNEPFTGPVARVIVDGTAPVLTGASASDDLLNAAEAAAGITVTASVTEANPYTVTVKDDNDNVLGTSDGGPINIDTSVLATGDHIFTVSVMDIAGNAAADTIDVTVTVDKDAPMVSLTGLNGLGATADPFEVGAADTTGTLDFSLGVSDVGVGVNGVFVVLDGVDQGSGDGSAPVSITLPADTDLSGAPLTYSLRVVDGAGNEGAAGPFNVHVDTTPPSLTFDGITEDVDGDLVIRQDEQGGGLTFTYTTDDGVGSGVTDVALESFDGGAWNVEDNNAGDADLVISAVPTAGTYTYRLTATDDYDNVLSTAGFDVLVIDAGSITVDALGDDLGDGTLDFTETGHTWSIDVVGTSVPADGAGCPCTYELDVSKDGALLETRTGAIGYGQTITEAIGLTGDADGGYSVDVRLVADNGDVLATDSDAATIAVQPKITAFVVTLDNDMDRDIAGTTELSAGSGFAEPMQAIFALEDDRAPLTDARLTSPAAFSRSSQGSLSGSDLVIPLNIDGSVKAFTLDLDSTDGAAHGDTEVFTFSATGAGGLMPLVADTVPTGFTYEFDKGVDTLTGDAVQTGFDEVTVAYTAQDHGFGLAKLELFMDGGLKQTVSLTEDTSLQDGAFAPVTGLADGTYVFDVVATDEVGNARTVTDTVVINEDADVTIEVLQGTTDRMGGDLVIQEDAWEGLTLRVTNAAGEPTISEVRLGLTAGASIVIDATGFDSASTGAGGVFTELAFLVDVPAGATETRSFSLRAVDATASGTWTVEAETESGFVVGSVNDGTDTLTIQTPELVNPTVAVASEQDGVALTEDTGILFATVDQPTHGELDDSDVVTFTVTVTDGSNPIEGATVTVTELSGISGVTDAAGEVAFTIDPDDHGLDFAAQTLTFDVAAQQATRNGVVVGLSAASDALDVLWTGFHVDVLGPDMADGIFTALGEAELDADVYWLHDVLQAGGSIDLTDQTPVTLGGGATLSLVESVGGQTHLTADQTDLEGDLNGALPVVIERGTNVVPIGSDADSGAGYRAYTAELGGALPNGLGAVFSSDEHQTLFTALRIVFDGVDSVGFGGQEVTVRAQWLHTTDLDGTLVDRFDLDGHVVAATSSISGALGNLEDTTSNTLTDAPTLVQGVNDLTVTGSHASLTVFQATTQMLHFDAAFTAEPADDTLLVGADYADSFAVSINGVNVDDAFTAADQTLTTALAGEDATSVAFTGTLLDLSTATVRLGSVQVASTAAYGTMGAWNLDVTSPEPGTHTLEVDLDVGSVDGAAVATSLSSDFAVTHQLYVFTPSSPTNVASADGDLTEFWVNRDAADSMLDVVVQTADWDGSTATNNVAAPDGTVVEVWVSENGGAWALGSTEVLGNGDGSMSITSSKFTGDAAGTRQFRFVVVDDDDATAGVPFPSDAEGLNAQTLEYEPAFIYSGVAVSFTTTGDLTALAGGGLTVDVVATLDHDGSPVDGLELTVSGTGLTNMVVATGTDGTATVTFSSAGLLKVTDLSVAVTDAATPHGLDVLTDDAYADTLRWVEVKVDSIGFEVSTDGVTFVAADPADVDTTTNTVTADANTYVRVASTVVLDDGSGAPPTADGGVVKYGTRSVSLDTNGQGTRMYFSSQAGSLGVAVAMESTTFGGETFMGGTGASFTIEWT